MTTLVIAFNIDTRSAYIYDLSSDDSYQPLSSYKSSAGENVFIDFASFPGFVLGKEDRICQNLKLDPAHFVSKGFCLLDEFYFFRTILTSESSHPTVVLKHEHLYWQTFTFEEFVHLFSQTYKIIYSRWKSLEPWTPEKTIPQSMKVMFQSETVLEKLRFREWLNRVNG